MKLLGRATCPGVINSLTVAPAGDRVAAAVDNKALCLFRVTGGTLEPDATWPISADRYRQPADRDVRLRETKVAYLDEATILVGRALSRTTDDKTIPTSELFRSMLLALDPSTGVVRGEFDTRGGLVMGSAPLSIGPDLVLLDLVQTVACIDARSFRALGRLREVDEYGDPVGDDVDPDETLVWNGLAYQPSEGLIYVLWRLFHQAWLERHRFDRDRGQFVRESRQRVMDGSFHTSGLCANPSGSGATAWFPICDELIEPRSEDNDRLPPTARLGLLTIIPGEGPPRSIEIVSETARDFLHSPRRTPLADGREVVTGHRIGVEDYTAQPVYIDDHTLLLNTPSGLLLRIDTSGDGTHEVAHDFSSPIRSLQFHRETRRLFVGCDDGTLHVLQA